LPAARENGTSWFWNPERRISIFTLTDCGLRVQLAPNGLVEALNNARWRTRHNESDGTGFIIEVNGRHKFLAQRENNKRGPASLVGNPAGPRKRLRGARPFSPGTGPQSHYLFAMTAAGSPHVYCHFFNIF